TIPECSKKYSGQEHATPDQERAKLDELLKDANKGLFDAVIVCDVSRWSRDNRKSKEGLGLLHANGIRFFVGTTEYDLDRPEHKLFLGMATEMNEFFAAEQGRKSILNRIARAERGIPTAGKVPYGKKYTEEKGREVDEAKKANIQRAANEYLKGG